MLNSIIKRIVFTTLHLFFYLTASTQPPLATIPWSSSLNITFENGITNTGSPLSPGYSDFPYASSPDYGNLFYSVIKSNNDAGHLYFGYAPAAFPSTGHKMFAGYFPSAVPQLLFGDTVRGLCGNCNYLFWAQINPSPPPTSCHPANLSFRVETLSGLVIDTFETGDIGTSQDHSSWYYGWHDYTRKPPLPFFGKSFQLPAGVTDIVVKILTNPYSAPPDCSAFVEVDNILLTPIGPDIRISSPKFPGGWITASCFEGNVPVVLNGKIEPGYLDFGTPNYVLQTYTNPAFQWQQSRDEGYTWTDIAGETNINIAHNFNIPDTFWIRLRVSEATNIANRNCSNVSNVFKVEVDGFPKDFSLTSNSPVCTDGDVKLSVKGGATYNTFGPNGFYDNSASPHLFHPELKDSGWYYSEIISLGGCKGVDSEYVKIIGPDLHVSAGKSICYGDTVNLRATGGLTYNWTPPDGLTNSVIANPVARPVKTTLYEVKVTDHSGCTAYGKIKIMLRDSVLKAAIDGPDVACPNEIIEFRDTSIGQITSWHWDFSNGITSNLKNPGMQNYPVANAVSFPVILTVTDTAGCVQSVVKDFKSVNNCFIAVPNAFTPNADGLNDFLYPANAYKATNLSFNVFNRKGNLVFSTKDWTKKWDGTFAHEPQDPGTYVWMLSYTDAKGKRVFFKGTTILIR